MLLNFLEDVSFRNAILRLCALLNVFCLVGKLSCNLATIMCLICVVQIAVHKGTDFIEVIKMLFCHLLGMATCLMQQLFTVNSL